MSLVMSDFQNGTTCLSFFLAVELKGGISGWKVGNFRGSSSPPSARDLPLTTSSKLHHYNDVIDVSFFFSNILHSRNPEQKGMYSLVHFAKNFFGKPLDIYFQGPKCEIPDACSSSIGSNKWRQFLLWPGPIVASSGEENLWSGRIGWISTSGGGSQINRCFSVWVVV